MDRMNYNHLLYFRTVAKEGTVARAAKELGVAQPTISGQIHVLEESLGEKLFERVGRNLVLTEVGHVVYRYANEIFTVGQELMDTLKGRPTGRPLRLRVGVADVLPKLTVHRLLQPAMVLSQPVQITCTEDKTDRLLAELAIHQLDLVLADSPIAGLASIRAFNHLLGECGVTFFGSPNLVAKYRPNFPKSLDKAPLLLPTENTLLRRSLEHWFHTENIHPHIVAEFEDSALMKVFGQEGDGIFAAPEVSRKEIQEHYGVGVVGQTQAVKERFYAITVERRIKHPAVVAIFEVARQKVFVNPARA